MAKTRAEIQRDYRERKKRNDRTFLENERKRKARYRIPAAALRKSDLEKRRMKSIISSEKYRQKKRKEKSLQQPNDAVTPGSSNQVDSPVSPTSVLPKGKTRSSSTTPTSPLIVQFSFPKRNTSTKRRSCALRNAGKKIKWMETENIQLRKRLKTVQKRHERLKQKLGVLKSSSSSESLQEMTPRSKTVAEMKGAGIACRDIPTSIRKKLQLANVISEQFKQTGKGAGNQEKWIEFRRVIAGRIVKKYRCLSVIHANTGIRRSTLSKAPLHRRPRASAVRAVLQEKVVSFFERDDVSRCMPGKRDATKNDEKQKIQTRIVTDYLTNIYGKFCSDNPDVTISFSKFCKLRPRHVKLTSMLSRNTCLCTTHQNMAMKLKCLHSLGLDVSVNPETASKEVTNEQMIELISQLSKDEIEYEAWEKVDVNGIKKMRIRKIKKNRTDFIEIMKKEYASFLSHVSRVRQQFEALAELKRSLPVNQAIVQMDFSENFVCQNADEVQSAYWHSTSVTLHPVVVYYKTHDGEQLQHKSYVFLSDLGDHNAKAVVAILNKLLPLLKELLPDLTVVHYWTDSPSSQYRNRYIFTTLCQHRNHYGVSAQWNYFECGHGKSVCDGLGGTAKRQASDAVKQGKTVIQDTNDFFSWASANEKEIKYIMYSQQDYAEASEMLSKADCQPIPGTMKVHAVIPTSESHMLVRSVSCYCKNCMDGSRRCEGWVSRRLKAKKNKPKEFDSSSTTEAGEPQAPTNIPVVGTFVAAIYSDDWYIGKVVEVDKEDQDAMITFMTMAHSKLQRPTFKWPHRKDELWIPFDDILTRVPPPTPIGKSERFFEVPAETLSLIKNLKLSL